MNQKLIDELDWRLRVFDSLSFPTLMLKPDKSIVSANHIFLHRNGVSMEQIIGKHCHEVFYGAETCPNEVCPFPKVLKDKIGTSVMRRHTTRTGKQLYEDRVFSPILDDDGEVAEILDSGPVPVTVLRAVERRKPWWQWPAPLRERNPDALAAARALQAMIGDRGEHRLDVFRDHEAAAAQQRDGLGRLQDGQGRAGRKPVLEILAGAGELQQAQHVVHDRLRHVDVVDLVLQRQQFRDGQLGLEFAQAHPRIAAGQDRLFRRQVRVAQ